MKKEKSYKCPTVDKTPKMRKDVSYNPKSASQSIDTQAVKHIQATGKILKSDSFTK